MTRCDPDAADMFLDGVAYQFTSYADAESYAARLRGLRGAVFTPRSRERWGPHMPVAVDSAQLSVASEQPPRTDNRQLATRSETWGRCTSGLDTETHRLPAEDETHG
jgi:hypothetical protein